MSITDPSQEYFKDGSWGWDGSQWRKLPLVFGYSERWAEHAEGAAVADGDAEAATGVVPPGYVYVVQATQTWHTAATDKECFVEVRDNDLGVILDYYAASAAYVYHCWGGGVVLSAGDSVRVVALAPGDGKYVAVNVWGYKMKVA